MKNPRWPNKKTKKTQGEISIRFLQILGKDRLFPGKKPTSPEKIPFYPLKILTTFFFSHRLSFSNFYPPFSDFQPKFTTEFLQIRYFQPKNLKFVYFLY